MKHRVYIKEMPWLKYSTSKGEEKTFDLELENFKDVDKAVEYIKDIFLGKKFKDKNGSTIQLKTWEEITNFYNELKNNSSFLTYVESRFTLSQMEYLNVAIWNAFKEMEKQYNK